MVRFHSNPFPLFYIKLHLVFQFFPLSLSLYVTLSFYSSVLPLRTTERLQPTPQMQTSTVGTARKCEPSRAEQFSLAYRQSETNKRVEYEEEDERGKVQKENIRPGSGRDYYSKRNSGLQLFRSTQNGSLYLMLQQNNISILSHCIVGTATMLRVRRSGARIPSWARHCQLFHQRSTPTYRRHYSAVSPTSGVPRGWGVGLGSSTHPPNSKALQNRAKLNPIVKTVKNC